MVWSLLPLTLQSYHKEIFAPTPFAFTPCFHALWLKKKIESNGPNYKFCQCFKRICLKFFAKQFHFFALNNKSFLKKCFFDNQIPVWSKHEANYSSFIGYERWVRRTVIFLSADFFNLIFFLVFTGVAFTVALWYMAVFLRPYFQKVGWCFTCHVVAWILSIKAIEAAFQPAWRDPDY